MTSLTTTVRRFGAALALATAVLAASAPPGWSQEPGLPVPEGTGEVHSWALAPGDGSLEAGERPNLAYQLPPGGSAEDVVTLYNFSNVSLTFRLYSTDAFNNEDGSFDVLPGDETPTDVGTWLSLPTDALTVPAGQQATFPITVRVPTDARPGDHAGALLASSETVSNGPDGDTVTLDRRTGTRVYVRVDGPLQPELAVEDLTTSYSPELNPLDGSAEVSYTVVNRGNVRLAATHALTIGGPFGMFSESLPAEEIVELLPGEQVTFTRQLDGVSATALQFTEVDLVPRSLSGEDDEIVVDDGRAFGLAIPFTIVALLLVAVLAWFARRAYLRHRDEDGVHEGDDAVVDLTDREPQLT